MNREILNIASKILSEEIHGRVKKIKNKIFENNKMKKQMCSECGGKMYEGECMECGSMYEGDIQELGGMDDGHPRFGNKNLSRMSKKEKEDLMSDRDYERSFIPGYDEDEDDNSEGIRNDRNSFRRKNKNNDEKHIDEDYNDDDDDDEPKKPSLSDLSRDMDYDDYLQDRQIRRIR